MVVGLGTDDIAFSNWPSVCEQWMIERGLLNYKLIMKILY